MRAFEIGQGSLAYALLIPLWLDCWLSFWSDPLKISRLSEYCGDHSRLITFFLRCPPFSSENTEVASEHARYPLIIEWVLRLRLLITVIDWPDFMLLRELFSLKQARKGIVRSSMY